MQIAFNSIIGSNKDIIERGFGSNIFGSKKHQNSHNAQNTVIGF